MCLRLIDQLINQLTDDTMTQQLVVSLHYITANSQEALSSLSVNADTYQHDDVVRSFYLHLLVVNRHYAQAAEVLAQYPHAIPEQWQKFINRHNKQKDPGSCGTQRT